MRTDFAEPAVHVLGALAALGLVKAKCCVLGRLRPAHVSWQAKQRGVQSTSFSSRGDNPVICEKFVFGEVPWTSPIRHHRGGTLTL
jgi:hypothetical protein